MSYYKMKLLVFSILSQLLYYVNSDKLIFLFDSEFNNSLCGLNSTGFINSLCELNSTGVINNSFLILITDDYYINNYHLNCDYSLEYDIFNISYLCNLISKSTNTSLEQPNLNYFIFNLENILIISVAVIMCFMSIFAIVFLGCNRPVNIIDNDIKNYVENDVENDFYKYNKQPGIIHNNLYDPLNIRGVGYIEVNNDDTYSLDDHEDSKESYNYLKDVYNMSTDF